MTDLDGLTALLAAATPGPWRHDGTPIVEWHHGQRNPFTDQGGGIEAGPEWDDRLNTPQPTVVIQGGAQDEQGGAVGILRDPDAALIVAAVNALPYLIEAARREAGLREWFEAHEAVVAAARNGHRGSEWPDARNREAAALERARFLLHDSAGAALPAEGTE